MEKTNELTVVTENNTEVITVSLDKRLVNRFDKAYNTAGESMKTMCMLAYDIVGEDKDAKKLFNTHVVCDLGMSKQTASQLIKAGNLYRQYPDTECLSHTKVVELAPVQDDFIEFKAFVGKTTEELNEMTQAGIRSLVKRYVNGETDDVETQAIESDTDAEDEGDGIELDDGKVTTKSAEEYDATQALKTALVGARNILEVIQDTYADTFEDEDASELNKVLNLIYETLK